MTERALIVLSLAVAFGCGTLSGTRQYQSIDSNPRGLEVTNREENVVLGTTPLFAHQVRSSSQQLRVRGVGGVVEKDVTLTCGYRWGGSLLGNAAWITLASGSSVLAGVSFAVANTVDLLTGAAWHCPDRVVIDAPELKGENLAERCPKYAVAPPVDGDEKISLLIAQRWAERAVTKPCVSVVDPMRTYPVFARYSVTHESLFEPALERRERLNALGYETGASHLAVLRVEESGNRLTVKPELYDLHSLAVTEDTPFLVLLEPGSEHDRVGVLAFLRRYVRLLPNSVGFAAISKDMEFVPQGDVTSLRTIIAPSSLPSIVGNLSVLWLRPPNEFDNWELAMKFTPTVGFSWNTRRLELQRPSGAETHDVTAAFLTAQAKGTLFWRTPIGIFSFAAGAGPGLTMAGENSPLGHVSADLWASAEVAWTLFVTEAVFVRLAAEAAAGGSNVVDTPLYRLDGFRAVGISVGYYLPEFRAWVRGLL